MAETLSCREAVAVILPSLDPDEKFTGVVDGLVEDGFQHIVIVDDGSDAEHHKYFDEAARHPQCTVLHHEVNKGKGRALKTAFAHVREHFPSLSGVVTIDGDGQHLLPDIVACADRMLAEGDKVVLGCRDFNQPGVPPRSVAGNKTTSRLFRLCYGIRLSDTQTGLRAIPASCLERFGRIEGERFEYETNMLLQMKRMGVDFVEQPITTVYDPEDYSSHYNAIKDSWRIFKIMFKFLLSSGASMLIDNGLFYLIMKLFGAGLGKYATVYATVIARIFSSFANFNANNSVVFGNKGNYRRAMLRYYCLCIPQMLVSAGAVTGLVFLAGRLLGHSCPPLLATLIKIVVDTILFFLSYHIQREWVFSSKEK